MPMIALGWCHAGSNLPPLLVSCGAGPVQVLCADEAECRTASDRLRVLQSVFDAGVDVVALSPVRIWPAAMAHDFATSCARDLVVQLGTIAGAGQLCVAATWHSAPPVVQGAGSGRDWLHHLRVSHHDRQNSLTAAQSALATLVADLDCAKTAVLPMASGCGVNLLVRRPALAAVRAQILAAGAMLTGPAGMAVTVSGLWPALDFVRLPTPMMAVPA